MNAKVEMKELRNYLRRRLRKLYQDPYIADIAKRLHCCFVKWDERQHAVLVCAYDITQPTINQWEWIWTSGAFSGKSRLDSLLNKQLQMMYINERKPQQYE